MTECWTLHANAEEVPEANLSNIISDELVVLQISARYISRSWNDGHVRLKQC
jgi:hypothetical protein